MSALYILKQFMLNYFMGFLINKFSFTDLC